MWAAAIPALAGVAGDVMSQIGGASAMAMNNRQFFANEAFQEKMLNQEEAYNTQMSNTAVQRRMADFRAAGLNPMLAAGPAGVASSPAMSALGGGMNPVQNPSQGFGALGSQIASAVQTGQQQKVADAQANNLQANADLARARVPYAAQQAAQDLENSRQQEALFNSQINNLDQARRTGLADMLQKVAAGNLSVQQAANLAQQKGFAAILFQWDAQLRALEAQRSSAGLPQLLNDQKFNEGWFGRNIYPYWQRIVPSILQGAHSAAAVSDMMAPDILPRGASVLP